MSALSNDEIHQTLAKLQLQTRFSPISIPYAQFEAMSRELMAYRDALVGIEGVGLSTEQQNIVSLMRKNINAAWQVVREVKGIPHGGQQQHGSNVVHLPNAMER